MIMAIRKLKIVAFDAFFRAQRLFIWKSAVKVIIIWLVFVTGSFLHDFCPLPAFYLSHKKNILNTFFVKKGWGWTCGLLSFYIAAALVVKKKTDLNTIGRNVLRLFYLTSIWYISTSFFEYVEHLTGFCEGEHAIDTKHSCIKKQSRWLGFDISGHCFLLSFCILILNEELQGFVVLKERLMAKGKFTDQQGINYSSHNLFMFSNKSMYLYLTDKLSVILMFLMILWEFMLIITCLYYHTVYQKVLGTTLGILAWYFNYNVLCKLKHPLVPSPPISFT